MDRNQAFRVGTGGGFVGVGGGGCKEKKITILMLCWQLENFLVAPCRAILRYTIAAIPHIAQYFLREASTPPKWCDTPPWYLVLHRHICAIPHFATYRAIIVRYSMKTSTREFCDTIATSIARYEKYRCWA